MNRTASIALNICEHNRKHCNHHPHVIQVFAELLGIRPPLIPLLSDGRQRPKPHASQHSGCSHIVPLDDDAQLVVLVILVIEVCRIGIRFLTRNLVVLWH